MALREGFAGGELVAGRGEQGYVGHRGVGGGRGGVMRVRGVRRAGVMNCDL